MKRQLLTLIGAVAIAACGSTARPPATPSDVTTAAPDDGHEPPVDEPPVSPGAGDHAAPLTAPPDPAQLNADLLIAETTAYQAAKPVFEKYCAGCHQQGGKKASAKKLGHLDITAYPFAGHHAAEVGGAIRKALGIGGGKPTMPYGKPGAVQGDELALIAAWADTFDAAHAAGAHAGMPGHDH